MIALLAAVPEETRLVRQVLQEPKQLVYAGLELTTGVISGKEVCITHSGVGKAAAAAAATSLICGSFADQLWLFGCGGAYPGSGLKVGDLALANAELFGDEGVETKDGFADFASMKLPMRQQPDALYNLWPVDSRLHELALPLLAEHAKKNRIMLRSGPFVTVSTCTGTTQKAARLEARTAGLCENMEGAAVALACQQQSIAMLELRGISNKVEDRDTGNWDLKAGMQAAQLAVMALLLAWPEQTR